MSGAKELNAESLRTKALDAKVLVFDFDGTLVDSNDIKWNAFELCFSSFPDRLGEIMKYCRGNPHIPRGEKFEIIYRNILRRPYTESIALELHERFNAETIERIIKAPEIPGVSAFLEKVSESHVTGVLSSVPTGIIRSIVEGRALGKYFQFVQGAPVQKGPWLADYMRRHTLNKDDLVYFGDAREDARAAEGADCIFVGVQNTELIGPNRLFISDFQGWA